MKIYVKHKYLACWLIAGAVMIYIMVVLGGITRLTGSGLSMVNWHIITGIVPPLNEQEWQKAFEQYKNIPQYKLINQHFGLAEFKTIFIREYIHRLWGRLIGVVFIVPFMVFAIKKYIPRAYYKYFLLLFLLGFLQALAGWYMVKSGLIDRPYVSPYRLTLHLSFAMLLLGTITALLIRKMCLITSGKLPAPKIIQSLSTALLILTILQVLYGGLMAGWKAAVYYPTWPRMNGSWLPATIWNLDPGWINLFRNFGFIQFMHRYIPVIAGILLVLITIQSIRKAVPFAVKMISGILWLIYISQFLLGVFTLINSNPHVPLYTGVIHQAVGMLFFIAILFLCLVVHTRPRETG